MRVAQENHSIARPKSVFAHDSLRCVLGIHRWAWWLHEDVCVRCVRCYRRGEAGGAPSHNASADAGGRGQLSGRRVWVRSGPRPFLAQGPTPGQG